MKVLWDLWKYGPSTVGEILERRNKGKWPGGKVGYTAILRQLQNLRGKGLVTVDRVGGRGKRHFYRAGNKDQILASVLNGICADFFDGSLAVLVQTALELGTLSKDELKRIRSELNRKLKCK